MFDFIYNNPFDVCLDYDDIKEHEDYFNEERSTPVINIRVNYGSRSSRYINKKFKVKLNNITNTNTRLIPTLKDTYRTPSYEKHSQKIYNTPYYVDWKFTRKGRGFFNPYTTPVTNNWSESYSSSNNYSESYSNSFVASEGASV